MIALPFFGLALSLPGSLEQLIFKALAVLGGAAVGGFGAGLAAKLLARLATIKTVPRIPLRITQVLGAVLMGLIVAHFVWGPGGGGGGGGGGWSLFGGSGTGDGGEKTYLTSTTEGSSPKGESVTSTGKSESSADETLRVEVLGTAVQDERWYRIKEHHKVYTLAEIQALVKQRVKTAKPAKPVKKLVIVLYENSPDIAKDQVRKLQEFARDQRLELGQDFPSGNAPKGPVD
jgi:hypothetical protein